MLQRYQQYLSVCNRHAWDEIASLVDDDVLVNGQRRSPAQYSQDLHALSSAFPDCHWQIRRAVVGGPWLAVHLHDTGTRQGPFASAPGDGRQVETEEFAL